LHRGGAIIIPTKEGKKVHLSAQPDSKLRQEVLR
jgi:hypothetical protein